MEAFFSRQIAHNVLLHITGVAAPAGLRAAERGHKMETGILPGQPLKFFTIKDIALLTHSENEPYLGAVRTAVEILKHGTDGRDAGSCGDEGKHGIKRLTQREKSKRPGKTDLVTGLKIE